jgi:hypothetical protein
MGDESSRMFGWCRCAAISAIVCSMAACSPPNPTGSSPDPARQSAEPDGLEDPHANEGDAVADEDDVEDGPSAAVEQVQAGSTTATSHAPPGKTCAAACRRFAQCELFSFKPCMKACADQNAEGTAESRRTNLVQARSSCKSLAAAIAPSQWLCIAEGESAYGHDLETGLSDVQGTRSIHLPAQGKTRADAERKAVRDCNAMMNFNLEIGRSMYPDSTGDTTESAVATPCHITRCYAPGGGRGRSSDR